MSTTACPCALRCLAWRLADVFYACGRPRVQETGSEASWHLLFTRRASRRWSWNFSKGSPMSAMRSCCGGVCACLALGWAPAISVRGRAALCRPCASLRALALANITVGFLAFCVLCDICHFCRAGMSCRVNFYSLSGGGSIDWVPGVVPAAWGGPWRAWRAVRAAPKTKARVGMNQLPS